MAIIGNPWVQEAGQFGSGLGNSLAQAMIQMPQQRAMLAMQAASQRQEQQQQMLHFALQQQANMQAAQLGKAEMTMKQAELAKQLQEIQHANQMQEQRLSLAQAGKWKITKMPDGSAILLNDVTGEHKRPDLGGGAPTGMSGIPATQNQMLEAYHNMGNLAGAQRVGGMDVPGAAGNAEFQNTTNLMAGIGQRLQGLMGTQQAPMQTNAPQLGGGLPTPPVPAQTQGATNAINRKFRWTPQGLQPIQ